MSVNYFIGYILLMISVLCHGTPPYEILRSCVDLKPKNSSIVMKDIDNGTYSTQENKGCSNQFEIDFENSLFGSVNCDDINYFIVNGKKININSAINMSVNPSVKPRYILPDSSQWYKIDLENKSFLCINGPISDTGSPAAIGQYFIIENAFSKKETPIIYYYFFNKDVQSITDPYY